jgi:hypothetical protein
VKGDQRKPAADEARSWPPSAWIGAHHPGVRTYSNVVRVLVPVITGDAAEKGLKILEEGLVRFRGDPGCGKSDTVIEIGVQPRLPQPAPLKWIGPLQGWRGMIFLMWDISRSGSDGGHGECKILGNNM